MGGERLEFEYQNDSWLEEMQGYAAASMVLLIFESFLKNVLLILVLVLFNDHSP